MAQITTGASFLSYRSSPEAEIMYLNRATPGASLIVAGSLLLLSAVLGFVGARNVSWPWLCVLGAALSLLTALQIVIAVVGFVEASSVGDKVHRSMLYTLGHHEIDRFRSAWDTAQRKHNCCGVDGFTDWDIRFTHRPAHGKYVPNSCCPIVNEELCTDTHKLLYRTGCHTILAKKERGMLTTAASLAVAAAVLEMLGIVSAILLSTIYQEKPGYQLY
ncbi:tetraspanin-3-like [Sycon ciliatum]|uniref:tetraspanin-3-like n=1 Tax=Sycon ciliatum TaxID=27933 RepID=UPI0031F632E3